MMYFASILFAYFLGSIPFGLLIGRWVKGVDVRKSGSGNLGATNVFRVVGKRWGVLVLFLDALKGFIAVRVPDSFFVSDYPLWFLMMLAVAAIFGHIFPIWLSFKGGKGVATSLGVFIAIAYQPTLLTFLLWVLIFVVTRIISAASLMAACMFPLMIYLTSRNDPVFTFLFPISLLLVTCILFTHRANIRRILKGEERRLF